LRVARRSRAERFYARGALERFRAARSTRTLGNRSTIVPRLFHYALLMALSGAAVYCFGRGLIRLLRENPELGWRQVPGKIILSEIDDSGKSKSAKIHYAYRVDGDHFEGKRIAPLEVWASYSNSAANFVRKYPSGREVTVFVNPTRLTRAVLEPQQQPIAAICAFLFGVILAVFAWVWWMHNLSPVA
jgi:hypothetical protein